MQLPPDAPFTTSQALASGVTRRQLAGPGYRQLFRGVYACASAGDTPLLRARAVLLTHPASAVASHSTVARLVRMPVPRDPDEHVTVPQEGQRRRRLGLRCHVAALSEDEIRVVQGVRVTSPTRLFVDLAALPLVDLVVAGDWLVRSRRVTVESLIEHCARTQAPHGARARRAASYVRERVDSPMETRLRMLLVLAGLPESQVNLEMRDRTGMLLRLDLSYPSVKLAVEYDGRHHLESSAQWERDVDRRNDLADEGWRLISVTSSGVDRNPAETVERVWRVLRELGWEGLRRPSDAWRLHFGA